MSISGDIAVIGAPNAWEPWIYSGVAYLFERTGTYWSGRAVHSSIGTNYQWFGSAVAAEGETVMISAPYTLSVGHVEVHVREAGIWKLQEGLWPPAGTSFFGRSLALQGETALIGANTSDRGVAYVFVREGTTWHQQVELGAAEPRSRPQAGRARVRRGGPPDHG